MTVSIRHDIEFRTKMVKAIQENKITIEKAAEMAGVTPRSIYNWVRAVREKAASTEVVQAMQPRVIPVAPPPTRDMTFPTEQRVKTSLGRRATIIINEPNVKRDETGNLSPALNRFARQLKNLHEKVYPMIAGCNSLVSIVVRKALTTEGAYNVGEAEAIGQAIGDFAHLMHLSTNNSPTSVYLLSPQSGYVRPMEEFMEAKLREVMQQVGLVSRTDMATIWVPGGYSTMVVGESDRVYQRKDAVSDADLERAHAELRMRAAQVQYPAVLSVVPTGSMRPGVVRGYNLSPGAMYNPNPATDVRSTSLVVVQSMGGRNDILEVDTAESIYPLPKRPALVTLPAEDPTPA